MYYIISTHDISFWKRLHVPYLPGSRTRDVEKFFEGAYGRRINDTPPIAICAANTKVSAAENIALDIAFISLCYNCPLNIYVVSDSYYQRTLDLGFASLRNFGNVSKLLALEPGSEEAEKLRVDRNTTYYNGDTIKIQQVVSPIIKSLNFKNKSIYSFKITPEEGFVENENS